MVNMNDLRQMVFIREFEKNIGYYFEKGLMRGTTHCSIGQEPAVVALMKHVDRDYDYIFSTHRCHAHYIAYCGDAFGLAAEMMGRSSGVMMGAGGSQHLCKKRFFSNGITGGMAPIAVGCALGQKRSLEPGICVYYLGDGGFNEGYVQEALNLAVVYKAPILFVLENNQYAMSTYSKDFTAGSIRERVLSFNMKYVYASQFDFETMDVFIEEAFDYVKKEKRPCFLEIETFRLCGHSKSDSHEYIPEDIFRSFEEKDIVSLSLNVLPPSERDALVNEVSHEVNQIFERAANDSELSNIEEYQKHLRG